MSSCLQNIARIRLIKDFINVISTLLYGLLYLMRPPISDLSHYRQHQNQLIHLLVF